jgi:hypothetical protein
VREDRQIGPIIVSAVVVTGFAVTVALVLTHTLPQGNEAVAHELCGALGSLAGLCVSYWVGSSAAAVRSNRDLRAATDALATSTPCVPPTPTGDKTNG